MCAKQFCPDASKGNLTDGSGGLRILKTRPPAFGKTKSPRAQRNGT